MRVVFLHGLGQTASDWDAVLQHMMGIEPVILELFDMAGDEVTYSHIMNNLEERCAGLTEPFCICGLSLGAILALDYTIHHSENVAGLIMIAGQYKSPTMLIDLQNIIFRCMPEGAFAQMGLSKSKMIGLTRSMRRLNFSDKLDRVTCSTTILCGSRGKANMRAAVRLSDRISGAELRIISGAGHEVNKDAPQEVAGAVMRIAGISAPSLH